MLIIANVLEFNGGTTFILRLCRSLRAHGQRATVLVLFNRIDQALLEKIKDCADVVFLRDLMVLPIGLVAKSPFATFAPLDFSRLEKIIDDSGRHVHVMGVFGLLLMARYLQKASSPVRLSVGVYHQNEFMFRSSEYYFARKAQEIFRALPSESIIFFNEENQSSYSRFYKKSYQRASVVPIGIELPSEAEGLVGDGDSRRIVSIGNLYDFKTYNAHLIKILPELRKVRPDLVYEIYGEGPNEGCLRKLVRDNDLDAAVVFKGRIPYEEFTAVLEGALAFVGSGTAIIEAAAHGIPALIGIESTQEPVTYGFLSDVPGLAYNEVSRKLPMLPMKDKLFAILESRDAWGQIALACAEKSKEFGVNQTVKGFLNIGKELPMLEELGTVKFSSLLAAFSFMWCAILHAFGIDTEFATRRNQGTIA